MEKTYCGNAKVIETKYGRLLKISFREDDLKSLHGKLENGWVNAVLKERKQPSKGGMTHYLEVDEWRPQQRVDSATQQSTQNDIPTINADDEVKVENVSF